MNYQAFENLLLCPECRNPVNKAENGFQCSNTGCGCFYPVYFGIPVMISCHNKVFQSTDFSLQAPPDIFFKRYKNPLIRTLKRLRPDVTLNLESKKNYRQIGEQLSNMAGCRVLVIGGSIDGTGIGELKKRLPPDAVVVESDVAHGPNTNIILDCHQVPFTDNSFDLVIAQAVLEHVLDPFVCVAEIYRVLKPGGQVYAETPFMQPVHGGKYDFHRFSFLGHRRLFRHFRENASGLLAGPGSSLAWSLRYFITSFAPGKKIDKYISYVANFPVFWVKYFDLLLNRNKGSMDAACGLFFHGTKEPGYVLPDHELLRQYRGYRY
ncbi:class I SAM-dependent methyltransferase [Sediminibacterium soli]|uniref:class I SAM-dependent methyltransferase n=1 Tax=Sediminibacterium soli TaxID=2698829 RepID=UPI00137AA0EE|nr:methyltransferase domain-containing protein [Sediminibacterium soli]NCI48046.1 methyltransferase domain-containing protein [Sediminibacterium soli]